MKYSTFNQTNNNQLAEPMFLGNPVNVSRFDQQKHETFERLTEKQLSFFWRPEEIDISKDRIDFKGLTDSEKHIFLSNLKYQTCLDSIQGRSPNVVLLPLASIPELETWIELWAAFEGAIHARSYTHIIRGIVDNPETVFDDIMVNPNILKRAENSSKYYDDLFEYTCVYNLVGWGKHTINNKVYDINPRTMKKKLYLCLVSINVLEAIRFYVSFACSFGFGERKLMEGNASIIKMIARDEACVDGLTEVATPTGWKFISELTPEDKVAQYDIYSADIEFVTPNKLIKNKTKILHQYTGSHINQVVTPDHRMVYLDNNDWHAKEALSEQFIPNRNNSMFVSGHLKYQSKTSWLTPIDKLKLLFTLSNDNREIQVEFGNDVDNKHVIATILVPGGLKYKRLIEIVENTKFKFIEENRKVIVTIPNKHLDIKTIDEFSKWVNLDDKSVVWCHDFIVELSFWTRKSIYKENTKYVHYKSINKSNIDIVQLIGTLSGYHSVFSFTTDKHIVKVYKLHMYPYKRFKRNTKLIKEVVTLNHEEEVYCVSVPTGAFLTRRMNEVSVTGNCHMNGTQFMINLMKNGKDDPETKEICLECENEVIQMFKDACEQEMEWADYLFKEGSMIGLNAAILKDYIRYITNIRMSAVEFKPLFPEHMVNPIPWINNWLTSDNVQVAPQETEITSYLVGQVTSDLDETDFDEFNL